MPAGRMVRSATGVITRERVAVLAGGAAGDHTLTGITTDDKLKSVHHLASPTATPSGFAAGAHAVTAGEETAGTLDIDTGLGADLEGFSLLETVSGVHVPFVDAAISEAAGVITVADGAATYAVTEANIIYWTAGEDAVDAAAAAGSPADLTSEFSITADDTINNAAGTATTGGLLLIVWYDRDYGIDENRGW